jgi:hypothetical protein
MLPVVGLRLGEGRSGSTLLMQLLATSPDIVFDSRYPSQYRFLSYFARLAAMATEPFDPGRHPSTQEFFYGPGQVWGPVPFASEVIDVASLAPGMLAGLWVSFSDHLRARHPHVRYYAEKLEVSLPALCEAGIPVRIIDLVRDPRDVLASVRSFLARGGEGFGWRAGMTDDEHLDVFARSWALRVEAMRRVPEGVDRELVRYEDLAVDLPGAAREIGRWLGAELDAEAVQAARSELAHHVTTDSVEASIGRWRHDLTPAEVARVEEVTGPLLDELGYR